MKKFVIKLLIVLLGTITMATGIAMYLQAGLGVDPFSSFVSGFSNITGLSYGRSSQTWMVILIIVAFFLERERLGFGTIINGLLVGFFVDLFLSMGAFETAGILSQVLTLGLASIVMAMGIGIYISGDLGEGPPEAIMVILHHRLKVNLKWTKIGMDFVLLLIGFLLGGELGLGTVVGVVVTGPIVDRTARAIHNIGFLKRQSIWK